MNKLDFPQWQAQEIARKRATEKVDETLFRSPKRYGSMAQADIDTEMEGVFQSTYRDVYQNAAGLRAPSRPTDIPHDPIGLADADEFLTSLNETVGLNGGGQFTGTYLREQGFDVPDILGDVTFDIRESMDRTSGYEMDIMFPDGWRVTDNNRDTPLTIDDNVYISPSGERIPGSAISALPGHMLEVEEQRDIVPLWVRQDLERYEQLQREKVPTSEFLKERYRDRLDKQWERLQMWAGIYGTGVEGTTNAVREINRQIEPLSYLTVELDRLNQAIEVEENALIAVKYDVEEVQAMYIEDHTAELADLEAEKDAFIQEHYDELEELAQLETDKTRFTQLGLEAATKVVATDIYPAQSAIWRTDPDLKMVSKHVFFMTQGKSLTGLEVGELGDALANIAKTRGIAYFGLGSLQHLADLALEDLTTLNGLIAQLASGKDIYDVLDYFGENYEYTKTLDQVFQQMGIQQDDVYRRFYGLDATMPGHGEAGIKSYEKAVGDKYMADRVSARSIVRVYSNEFYTEFMNDWNDLQLRATSAWQASHDTSWAEGELEAEYEKLFTRMFEGEQAGHIHRHHNPIDGSFLLLPASRNTLRMSDREFREYGYYVARQAQDRVDKAEKGVGTLTRIKRGFYTGVSGLFDELGGALKLGAHTLSGEDTGVMRGDEGNPISELIDDWGNHWFEHANNMRRENLLPESEPTSINSAIQVTSEMIPLVAASIAAMVATRGTSGITSLFKSVAGRKILQSIKAGVPLAIPMSAVEAGVEGGSNWNQALQEGKSEAEARNIGMKTFAGNMAILVPFNAAQFGIMFPGARGAVYTRLARAGGKAAGMQVMEGAQEVPQEWVSAQAAGKEFGVFSPEAWDIFLRVTIGAAPMGILGAAPEIGQAIKGNESAQATWEDIVVKMEGTSFGPERTLLNAIDEFAEREPEAFQTIVDDSLNLFQWIGKESLPVEMAEETGQIEGQTPEQIAETIGNLDYNFQPPISEGREGLHLWHIREIELENGEVKQRVTFATEEATIEAVTEKMNEMLTTWDAKPEYFAAPLPEAEARVEKYRVLPEGAEVGDTVHEMPDGTIMAGPEHEGAVPGTERVLAEEDFVPPEDRIAGPTEGATAPSVSKEPWEMTDEEFDTYKDVGFHGTGIEFETFDIEASKKWDKFGIWFSADKGFVDVFGSKTKAATISLDNPKVITADEWNDIRAEHAKDDVWFKQWKEELIAQGYDGLIIEPKTEMFAGQQVTKPKEMAAFYNSQIMTHKQLVAQALSEGKPVPAEVLADYPDLKAPEVTEAPISQEEVEPGREVQAREVSELQRKLDEVLAQRDDYRGRLDEYEKPPGAVAEPMKAPQIISTKERDKLQAKLVDLDSKIEQAKDDIENHKLKIKELRDTIGYEVKLKEARTSLAKTEKELAKLRNQKRVIDAKLKGEEEAVLLRQKIQDIKEDLKDKLVGIALMQVSEEMQLKKKEALIKEIRAALYKYVKENLPPSLRGRLLTQIRDVKTDRQLEKAIDDVDRIAEAPKRIEEAKRLAEEAMVQGTIVPSKAEMSKAEAQEMLNREFYDAIVDSEIDVAATRYMNTNDFEQFVNDLPSVAEMDLKTLRAELVNAITQIQVLQDEATTKKDKDTLQRIINNLKKGDNLTNSQATTLGIALQRTGRLDYRGREVLTAALRKSGFYVTEDFARSEFSDVPHRIGFWMDPSRLIQTIDLGRFAGSLQKYVLWPTKRMFLSKKRYADTRKHEVRGITEKHGFDGRGMKKHREAAGIVIEHIGSEELNTNPTAILDKQVIPEGGDQYYSVRELLEGFTDVEMVTIVKYAQDCGQWFEARLDEQNKVRIKQQRKEIGKIEGYRPWIVETNLWAKLFGSEKTKEIMEAPVAPDFINPDESFNPRSKERTEGLKGYLKKMDVEELMFDYSETAAKDIFYTAIIANAKVHSAYLKVQGYDNSAALIDEWISEVYAGVLPTGSKFVKKIDIFKTMRFFRLVRRQLTRAVFPLNWTWNIFVQTSSIGLSPVKYGIQNTAVGMQYIFNPTVREQVQENAYSHIIKSNRAGSMVFQDIGASVEKSLELEGSPLDKAEHYANFLTTIIEDNLTGISIWAAYQHGQSLGLEGRALWEYASEGGAKTQSMYNFEDVPGVLRTKEVGVIAPFQTFAFEIFNTVRELNIIGIRKVIGKAGAYETLNADSAEGQALVKNRVKSILTWVAIMMITNALADKAIDRKPWVLSSFLPFYGIVTGGVNAGNPWNMPLPLQYTNDFKKSVDAYIKYGNWEPLRKFITRYHVLGGTQFNRMWEGITAVSEGEKQDVRGKKMFDIDTDNWFEVLKVITMGPYASKEGREYISEHFEDGLLEEIIGIDLPDFGAGEEPTRSEESLEKMRDSSPEAIEELQLISDKYEGMSYAEKEALLEPAWFDSETKDWSSYSGEKRAKSYKSHEIDTVEERYPIYKEDLKRVKALRKNVDEIAEEIYIESHPTASEEELDAHIDKMIEAQIEYDSLPLSGEDRDNYLNKNRDFYEVWLRESGGHARIDFGT